MKASALLVHALLRHAEAYHGATEVVSRTVEGPVHRTTYAEVWQRSVHLANALRSLGLNAGDRVGTLAWNGFRHLELYFGAPAAGLVCHTINPRLFADQVAYIIKHADDRILFVDLTFVPLLEGIAVQQSLPPIVVLTGSEHMPASTVLKDLICYETLVSNGTDNPLETEPDENSAAAMCYTSGATGDPKGVVYSHRALVLHAMARCLPDAYPLSARSVVMPIVPMFHVNAWGIPHSAPMVGAKLVLPGPKLDPASLHELIVDEGVTDAAGVPTVWLALLEWARDQKLDLAPLRNAGVGGAACPPSIFLGFRALGVDLRHGWGMTETQSLGLVNAPVAVSPTDDEEAAAFFVKQGRPPFGIEIRVLDDAGEAVAADGVAFGALQARGLWVTKTYEGVSDSPAYLKDGWFNTGDVVTVDPQGFARIVDRTKDLIKSGGEWISSIELEDIAMSHPLVREAAVVARADKKWGERPLLVVTTVPGSSCTRAEMLMHFEGRIARWCVPDDVVFVDELPHTATGKVMKTRVRELYGV